MLVIVCAIVLISMGQFVQADNQGVLARIDRMEEEQRTMVERMEEEQRTMIQALAEEYNRKIDHLKEDHDAEIEAVATEGARQSTILLKTMASMKTSDKRLKTQLEEVHEALEVSEERMKTQLEEVHEALEVQSDMLEEQQRPIEASSMNYGMPVTMSTSAHKRVVGFGVISTREEKILKGARVKYNRILSNTGQYNHYSHEFRCPVTGYYMFSLGVASNQYSSDIAILMNGRRIVSTTASGGTYPHGSNTMVVRCSTGSRVWVSCIRNGHCHHRSQHEDSSFSGFLIG